MQENLKKSMSTENFTVYLDEKENANLVYLRHARVPPYSSDSLCLDPKEAPDVTTEELKFIPWGIMINDSEDNIRNRRLVGHNLSIVDHYNKGVIVGFLILGIRDDDDTPIIEDPVNPDYLRIFHDTVEKDPRFWFDLESQSYGDPTGINQRVCSLLGTKYIPYGPFSFYCEIEAKTFGEVASKADAISFELNKKVVQQMIKEGKL